MSALELDRMDDATKWKSLEPDGVTPSTELSVASDTTEAGYGPDGISMRLVATEAADGHTARRQFDQPIALSRFSELRLSVRADRAAAPDTRPFFLELRLGSSARPLSSPANTWHRLLPVTNPNRWETVKLGIDDLDAEIRAAVDVVELRCRQLDSPFEAHVDDLAAVEPEMLADTDRGLETRLRGITVGGTTVPAVVRASSQPVPGAAAIDITHLDLAYAPHRVRDAVEARDYTAGGGVRLVAIGEPYDVTYAIAPVASIRTDQAVLLEQVVDRLAALDELVVDGERLPVEVIRVPPLERVGGAPGPDPVLFYRVGARAWRAPASDVRAVQEIDVETHYLEPA